MRQYLAPLAHLVPKKIGFVFGYLVIFLLLSFFAVSVRGYESTDRLFDTVRTTPTRNEVVIVGIDDKSLREFGAWPWNREVFADLTKALDAAGVRVSAYDVLFFEPRDGDEAFREALNAAQHPVLLASKVEQGTYLSSYLISGTTTLARSALANVDPDRDGKVRRYPAVFNDNGTCIRSLSEAAFAMYARQDNPCTTTVAQFRYPSNVPIYSLVDVIRGEVSEEVLRNKVVFIGSTSLGLEDHFVGISGDKVPGVYVHASAFVSRLNDVYDVPVSKPVSTLLIGLFMIASAAALHGIRRTMLQLVALFSILAAGVFLSITAYSFGYSVPLPSILAAVLFTFGYGALVRFVQEREQNLFIEQLFSKYVHKDVLKELIASGKELTLGGERKELTVLFSDLRGFTTFSESMSPEKLTSMLNDYLSAMTPCILEEKGTIDKFIGDAVMAFWNAPLDVADHPLHAVKSALRMQRTLSFWNGIKGTNLAMGIGVHTGACVVGNVGGRDRVNYTILGDTVNLTSRLEGLTKKYGVGIIVTKAVRDKIDDPTITFRCLDVITVLGKSTPTTLYEARFAEDFDSALIKKYEKALTYYYNGEWEKAETSFKKLAKEGDLPSEKMLARIPELRKKKDWDGIWRFDEK